MARPLVRSTRFLFSLCLALGTAAVAFVPLHTQQSVASISATTPSSGAPPGTQGNRALAYPKEQQSDDPKRKSADASPRSTERQSVQRQGDDALLSPGTQEDEEEDDPDLPGFLRGRLKINKAEYLRQRSEYIGMMRGFGDDPLHVKRAKALQQLEQQLRVKQEFTTSLLSSNSVWRSVGPAPIPNGQTTDRSDPVSGRAISIAIHPTNPDIVYVGTSQGGLYRSLDGGTTWIPLMDTAQSLSIGALALAPSNPSILYVGTGENGISADSFFGVGIYRIDNADTNATLVGPINPPVTTGINGTTAFTGRAVSEILVHPTDPATIFVATASGTSSNPSNLGYTTTPPLALRGVYRSTNATSSSPTFTKLTVTSANSVAPDTSGDRDIMDIAMEPGNPNVVLAWVGGTAPFAPPDDTVTGVYRTTNALGAATFTQTFTSTLAGARGEFAINKIGNTVNVVVATGEDGSGTLCSAGNGAIRTSSDGGATWSDKKPGGGGFCGNQCFFDIAVEMHPTDPNIILLGGSSPASCSFDFARSTNGAMTNFVKTNTGLHADTHALAISPSNPNVVYIGNDGGIWKSTDTGQTWTSLNNSGFNATQFQDMALHPLDREFMIGGTQDNGTEFKQPNGVWKRADFGDGGHTLIDQSATDTTNVTMYHTYFNQTNSLIGFAKITNSGCANEGQWSFRGAVIFATDGTPNCPLTPSEPGVMSNGMGLGDAVRFYPPMALGPGTPNSVYIGTDKLYRDGSTRGDSMTIVSQDLGDVNNAITSIGISRLNDNVRIIGTFDGKVFATTTGANPMTNVTDTAEFPALIFGVRRAVTDIAIDPNNSQIAYIAFGGYEVQSGRHIFKTTDLNATLANPSLWTPSGNGIPDVPVDALVIDPASSNIIYAGTDIGVYISTDAGANWSPFSTGLPRVAVFDLEIQAAHRVLRAVTHGRGMWEIELVGDLPGISDIPDQVTNQNTPDTTPFAVGSATGNPNALVLSATLANPALASVSFSGTGNDRMMLITPAANKSGTTEITVTVTEGAKSNSDSFLLTINPINSSNHAPVLDNTGNMLLNAINEDVSNASNSGTTVSDIIASAGGDRITDPDAGALEGIAVIGVDNTNGTWQFTVNNGGAWTPFGSPTPATARLLAVAPMNRVRFVPNANFNGAINPGITFRAWDQTSGTNGDTADTSVVGGTTAFSTATETASITVNPVNDAPVANAQTLSTQEDVSLGITLTGTDVETASGSLVYTVTLAPSHGVLSGTGANRTYTPTPDYNGPDSFKFTVTDTGDGTSAPLTSAEATVSLTVNAVNDAPVNAVPGAQSVIENDTLSFSSAHLNQISISDVDAGTNMMAVTLTATNGTLTLNGTSGLTFTPPGASNDGVNDAQLIFTGTIASINAALNGLVFSPTPGYDGLASVQIQTSDQGFTGSGGFLVDNDTIKITVLDGGTLAFSAATYTVDEASGTATITVNRTGGSNGETRVNYETNDGTAIAGNGKDYLSSTGQLIFPNGVTTQTFNVIINNDTLNEAPETIKLKLSNVAGSGALGAQKDATLTITDNDAQPSLSISDVSLNEGNSGQTSFNFTVTLSAQSGQTVTVNYSTADGTATAPSDYTAIPGTLLTFNPGDTSKIVTVLVNGDTVGEADETFFVNLSGAVNAAISDNQGQGAILSDDMPVIQFNSSIYSVNEDGLRVTIEVARLGNLSHASSVRFSTVDSAGLTNCNIFNGIASPRCDFALSIRTLNFAPGETLKTISVPIVNDTYAEGPETFTATLSNFSDADPGTSTQATIMLLDDDLTTGQNPLSSNGFLIRQLYIDLLGREPDPPGFQAWQNLLNNCPAGDTSCDRISVSSGFFRSPEFQERGYFIYRFYSVALGRKPNYAEFMPDLAKVSGFLTEAEKEANKVAFVQEFMARAEFKTRYDAQTTPTSYVDALLQTAGLPNHPSRAGWIAGLTNSSLTREGVLRQLAESAESYDKFYNEAFVVMQYFGYLRRDPDKFYLDWIKLLNQNNDFRSIIDGFISSEEFRIRFGQ